MLVAIPLRGLYRFTGGTMEEGFMLYFPELLRRGYVPNVDFLHLYGPGSLQALMGWYELFGNSLAAERTFGLLQHLGIIFGLFALARPWGRLAATAVAAFAVFYVMTPDRAHGDGVERRRRPDAVERRVRRAAGLHLEDADAAGGGAGWSPASSAGLALTFRPDLVVAVGLVLGWLLLAPSGHPAPGPHRRASIGLIPMWVHLVMAGPAAAFEGHGRWTRSSSCGPDASCPGRRRGAGSTARSRRWPRRSRRGGGSPTSRPRTPCSCGSA